VCIETHIGFGLRNIVDLYDEHFVYPEEDPDYHSASPVAMVNLAKRKGYRLVGANRFGFNTIDVRNDLGLGLIPEKEVEDVLQHAQNKERFTLFEAVKDFEYVDG